MFQVPLLQADPNRQDGVSGCARPLGPCNGERISLLVNYMCTEGFADCQPVKGKHEPCRDMHLV